MFLSVQCSDGLFYRWEPRRKIAVNASTRSCHFIRRPSRNIKYFTPFSDTKTSVLYGNKMIKSGISCLLSCRFPTAISWHVISIVVDAANRMFFRRTSSNVREKLFKTVAPLLANSNSATSIIRIFGIVGIVAAKFKSRPCRIFRRSCHAMCSIVSVLAQKVCGCFSCKAPATECGFSNIGSGGNSEISTITLAFPHGITSSINFGAAYNAKSSEAFACECKCWHHIVSLFHPDTEYELPLGGLSICLSR